MNSKLFVTVGTDGPFDRLIGAIDRWAGQADNTEVFAQIGRTGLRPRNIRFSQLLEPTAFREKFLGADAIVAHAGMGTILSALQYQKPILVMPRRASLGEQRNEHQLATARHLLKLGKIAVAFDEDELVDRLNRLNELRVLAATGPYASESLINALRGFIHSAH